jgi:dTDP-4-amino-4,6-dideoxygalactose transaminase
MIATFAISASRPKPPMQFEASLPLLTTPSWWASKGGIRRDQVYRDILNRGFDVGLSLYPNVHETEGYTSIEGRTTNVSMLARSVLTLPTHTRVTPTYADELAVAVRKVLGRN